MPSKSAVRYRHDDDGISLEGKGRKHKAHASLHKRKGGSSRSSHSHSRSGSKRSSHKSKRYYSEPDSSSASSESTFLDSSDSEWGYSSDDTAVTSRSAKSKSTGILTILRGKRDKDDSSNISSRTHKSVKSVTAWRPSRDGRGGTGIREAFGVAAFLYAGFQHLKDRYNGEHTSKLHHAMLHAGVFEGVHRRNVRVKKDVKRGHREPYERKPYGRPRRRRRHD